MCVSECKCGETRVNEEVTSVVTTQRGFVV